MWDLAAFSSRQGQGKCSTKGVVNCHDASGW